MSNIKVTMFMGSPIATTSYIYLDALLAAAVMKEKLGEEYFNNKPNEQQIIDAELPLEKEYGVWCASIGFGDSKEIVTSWSKRWDNNHDDLVNFEGKGKERVDIGSGYYKSYHMPLIIKSYKTITFYARGDMKEVERLLTTYIHNIGKKAAQGYGEIKDIKLEEIEEDWSLWKSGKPMRPIPVKECAEYIRKSGFYNIQTHSIIPPYWRRDKLELCIMPEV